MIKHLVRVIFLFFVINFYGQEISWNYDDNYKNTGSKVFSTSLSEISKIDFEVLNHDERSSSVTADNVEFRDISKVNIVSSDENKCTVLFDSKHSIEDKILNEQFNY